MTKRRKAKPPPADTFRLIKALLAVSKVAWPAKFWPAPAAGVLLHRLGQKQALVATDGLCMVIARTDRRLDETGGDAEFVLPRPLVDAVLKTRAKPQALVEVDVCETAVLAAMPDGMRIEAVRKKIGAFPHYQGIPEPPRKCVTIEINPRALMLVLRTIVAAGAGIETVKLRVAGGLKLLWITAGDGEAEFVSVISGADVTLPGMTTAPEKPPDEETPHDDPREN